MEYGVTQTEDVEVVDLSGVDDVPPDLKIRPLETALGLQNLRARLWYFEPGDEITYHAHDTQEEFFYIIAGRFSLKLGRSGETEIVEVGPESFYAARPGIGHGHRYLGEDQGIILAIGSPAIDDPGLDPHRLE